MNDPYLYEDSSVLRNLLNIHDEKEASFVGNMRQSVE